MALFIKLLLKPFKQKIVDHALHNQRLNFLNKCVLNEEWIIDQFSLKRRQKKRNGWGYGISKEYQSKWHLGNLTVGRQKLGYFSLMKYFGFIDVNRTVGSP